MLGRDVVTARAWRRAEVIGAAVFDEVFEQYVMIGDLAAVKLRTVPAVLRPESGFDLAMNVLFERHGETDVEGSIATPNGPFIGKGTGPDRPRAMSKHTSA